MEKESDTDCALTGGSTSLLQGSERHSDHGSIIRVGGLHLSLALLMERVEGSVREGREP
jgi:hypothetical protein